MAKNHQTENALFKALHKKYESDIASAYATLLIYFTVTRNTSKSLWVSKRISLQLLRPGFLVASIVSLFIGLTYLPIAEATVIGFMSPLFITVLASPMRTPSYK